MKTLARPALRSAATSISTMAGVRIRALTERHPIKPTSPRCHSAWQLNLGRHSTYRRGKSVQTTGTTSDGAVCTATFAMGVFDSDGSVPGVRATANWIHLSVTINSHPVDSGHNPEHRGGT